MTKDNVVNPEHYQPNAIFKKQPIEVMYESMTKEAFMATCSANVFKYTMRYEYKNGVEDLRKAQQYLEYMIRVKEGKSPLEEVE